MCLSLPSRSKLMPPATPACCSAPSSLVPSPQISRNPLEFQQVLIRYDVSQAGIKLHLQVIQQFIYLSQVGCVGHRRQVTNGTHREFGASNLSGSSLHLGHTDAIDGI